MFSRSYTRTILNFNQTLEDVDPVLRSLSPFPCYSNPRRSPFLTKSSLRNLFGRLLNPFPVGFVFIVIPIKIKKLFQKIFCSQISRKTIFGDRRNKTFDITHSFASRPHFVFSLEDSNHYYFTGSLPTEPEYFCRDQRLSCS